MAAAKKKSKKSSSGENRRAAAELDDIELLNIYRYPSAYPAAVVAEVRNSKLYQKRLEELLRNSGPQRRMSRSVVEKPVEQREREALASLTSRADSEGGASGSGAERIGAAERDEPAVRNFFKKLLH